MNGSTGGERFPMSSIGGRMDRLGEFRMAAHPIAVAPAVDDVADMERPAQELRGHPLISENTAPFLKAHLRG